jgi:hypothetical protein
MIYADKIGLALIALEEGEVFDIEQKVKEENRTNFVQIVKQYIDKSFGNSEGWEIEFNSTYKKIRKIRLLQ